MYQWVRPGFVQDGYNVYLNVDAVQSEYEQQMGSGATVAALNPLRAVGLSAQTDNQGGSQAHLQLLLARRDKVAAVFN
jgi:hypothetical protein